MKKILVFYGSYGGGHLSAAKAVKAYIEKNYSNYSVEMIDCIEYINKFVNKLTTMAYSEMAKKHLGLGKEFITVLKKVFYLKLVILLIN